MTASRPGGPAPDRRTLAAWLAEDFREHVERLEQVEGGADAAAVVWRATTRTGAEYAVKWTQRQTRTGLRLAAAVDAAAPVGLAQDGRAWTRRGGGRLSLARWIDGDDAATTGLTLEQWMAYGALLASVHAHPFPPPGHRKGARKGIRRRRTRYRVRLAEMDAIASAGPGAADDGVAAEALTAWREARGRIALLLQGVALPDDRTDVQLVPCHGDPHLGNVVVDGGRLRLIDWDDAVVAPRELDLHLVVFSVLFTPLTAEQGAAFRHGYGFVALDETRLVRYACVRALEDLVSTAHAAVLGPVATRAEELRVFRGILSPVGSASLVEPRLRTLLEVGAR